MLHSYLFLILFRRRQWCDNIQCLHQNMNESRGRKRKKGAIDERREQKQISTVEYVCTHTQWEPLSRIGSFSSIYMIYCYSCASWCLKKQKFIVTPFRCCGTRAIWMRIFLSLFLWCNLVHALKDLRVKRTSTKLPFIIFKKRIFMKTEFFSRSHTRRAQMSLFVCCDVKFSASAAHPRMRLSRSPTCSWHIWEKCTESVFVVHNSLSTVISGRTRCYDTSQISFLPSFAPNHTLTLTRKT